MFKSRRMILTAIAASAVALGGAGVALAANAAQPTPAGPAISPGSAVAGRGVSAISSGQAAAFSALHRAQTAADRAAVSTEVLKALWEDQNGHGANPGLARLVASTAHGSVLLVPGSGSLCIASTVAGGGTSASCLPNGEAETGGLGTISWLPGGVTLQGVLPRGSHSVTLQVGGHAVPVPISADGGYSITVSRSPTQLSYLDSNEILHHQRLPAPPSAP